MNWTVLHTNVVALTEGKINLFKLNAVENGASVRYIVLDNVTQLNVTEVWGYAKDLMVEATADPDPFASTAVESADAADGVLVKGKLTSSPDGAAAVTVFAADRDYGDSYAQWSANGRRFDMPFTYTRAEALRIPIERRPFDFDLYPVVKKHSGINAFTPNLKQTTLENFMGLWNLRKDTIDGGKSVMMYYDWLSSRDDGLREKILLHNHDDVLQLYRLLSALSRVDMHAAMRGLGFPVVIPGGPDPRSEIRIVKSSELKGGKLMIEGRRPAETAPYDPYVDYGIDGPAVKIGRDGRFRITADVSEKEGFTFIDIDALGIAEGDIEEPVASSAGYLVLATPACENDLELNVISRILATRLIF